MTVVLASAGYPASSSKGDVIGGLGDAGAIEGVEITHAGTAASDGAIVTAGGRVLNVTGLGQRRARPGSARTRRRADLVRRHADAHRHRGRAVERVAAG